MNSNDTSSFPSARIKKIVWPGAIYLIPALAILVVGWIAVRAFFFSGTEILIKFPAGEGITPAGTPVRYKGIQIGTVDGIKLSEDLHNVLIRATIKPDLDSFTLEGARYWIEKPGLSLEAPSELLTGAYIAASPGAGEEKTEFTGLEKAPIMLPNEPGEVIRLRLTDENDEMVTVQDDTPIIYRGRRVGKVLGTEYRKESSPIAVLFVDSPFDEALNARTVFWKSGGLSAEGSLNPLSLNISSIKNVLSDWVKFDELPAGVPTPSKSLNLLYSSKESAERASIGPHTLFLAYFSVDGQAPKKNAPVIFGEMFVGRVQSRKLVYDSQNNNLLFDTEISLDSGRFFLPNGPYDPQADLKKKIAVLVTHGLRAVPKRNAVIFGETQVELVMKHNATALSLDTSGTLPRIPTVSGGGDITSLITQASGILAEIESAPIGAVVRDIQQTTSAIRSLASGPEIERSLQNLDKTLASLRDVAANAEAGFPDLLNSLQNAANSAEAAASSIKQFTGGGIQPENDLSDLITEMTQAAEAIRRLADLLSRKPESLLRGK